MKHSELPREVLEKLHEGVVIPALPLALDQERRLDRQRQKALVRYYLEAGAGGVAVAVHTTQFEIRRPDIALLEPVLKLAAEEFDRHAGKTGKDIIRVAGIVGDTTQAEAEAKLAVKHAYHAGLLSLAALPGASNETLLKHCKKIAAIMPLVGFYLQPAVGGRKLDVGFWREFAQIDNVIAIKMAPFNRYQTLDVVRGVAQSGRAGEIALYTGNDDNILVDLLTEYNIPVGSGVVKKRIVGGLLGHWAVWTRSAVQLLEQVHQEGFEENIPQLLGLAAQITDSNAAFFDAANDFKGCIAGIHEVLRRQGFLEGIWTLNKEEQLSPGQPEEINRVYEAYPHLNDDAFIAANLQRWLS